MLRGRGEGAERWCFALSGSVAPLALLGVQTFGDAAGAAAGAFALLGEEQCKVFLLFFSFFNRTFCLELLGIYLGLRSETRSLLPN